MTKKKPFYIWFSLVALALLWGDTTRRIMFSGSLKQEKYALWLNARTNIAKLSIMSIVIPPVVIGCLSFLLFGDAHEKRFVTEGIIIFILLTIYLTGVYATYKHVEWRNNNLSHIMNQKLPSKNILNRIKKKFSFGKNIDIAANNCSDSLDNNKDYSLDEE